MMGFHWFWSGGLLGTMFLKDSGNVLGKGESVENGFLVCEMIL